MSREIKFRAWDNQSNEMIRHAQCCEMLMRQAIFDNWDGKNGGQDYKGWITFMQLTGLLDKNGKETYHKDIIIGRERKDAANIKEGRYVIEWEDAGFVAKLISGEGCDTWAFFFQTDLRQTPITEFEIIGNAFENPELLKQ